MARIAYIFLCHKDPQEIIAQAKRLTDAGDYVAIHFDKRANAADYQTILEALSTDTSVAFTKRRIKCGWGEWSLVEATLLAVSTAEAAFPDATHFYMLSGDCMPIKSAEYAHNFLDRADIDYIESFDYFTSDWIKIGLKEERLIYRHWFNERKYKSLFYASMNLQKRFGLTRQIPADIAMQIGSQWWCLRRRTIEWILDFCSTRKDVMRFFKTTWIPDETFFQTLVRHLVPDHEIETRSLTFLMFTDYGMPVVFYNDHFDLLTSQDYLFARKISPQAKDLKQRLGALYRQKNVTFDISNEGKNLFQFLTGRGRIGRRFAPRFWETESSIGRDRTLLMITCKKWHVAKRLTDRIRNHTNIPAVDYLFNEASTQLPDLGGIQTNIEKRTRHRRALVHMLFDNWNSSHFAMCIDPANLELMRDFYMDRGIIKLLELQCNFDDAYLVDHAQRMGVISDKTPIETIARLLPTIRYDVTFESERIKDADFENFFIMHQNADLQENRATLAKFLDVSEVTARDILDTDSLFLD
jgi:hypothetical protein